ncbi:MAG: YtxH domain-containing protein [Candidatus Gracilibacteria bacterium]|jgi:gas vesicle protein
MSEEKKEEGLRILDKVVMGAIVGGAIGSILGASLAPKKGSETRKDLMQAASKAKEKSFSFLHKLAHLFRKK